MEQGEQLLERAAAIAESLRSTAGSLAESCRPARTIARRIILDAQANPVELYFQEGFPIRSVLIENPNAAAGQIVEVGFRPRGGRVGQSDRRVPRQTGTMIVHTAEIVSLGMDPAVVPGGGVELFVTLYDRPQAPHSYPFAP